ncbi:MAG: IS200/IS605 family transposase [Methanosarcinales archaeon]|nr:MAG: IS200/IS605 family transposase [Methanosarcinales archaeon]
MNRKELRHDRHTVSLLTDHLVFSPIEIAVNPDHVHIFFNYPPKYSLSYIAKRIKGSTSRILRKEFPHLKEWCGEHFWAPSCFHGSVGNGWDVVEKYIREQDMYEYNREK